MKRTYLSPLPRLGCLHDPCLKPTHRLINARPVTRANALSSGGKPCKLLNNSLPLCFLCCRLSKCSRDQTPDGSLPACTWHDIVSLVRDSMPILSITEKRSLSPSSSTRIPSFLLAKSLPLYEENVGLTTFHTCSRMGLGSVSTPGEQHPRLGQLRKPKLVPLPFWLKLITASLAYLR